MPAERVRSAEKSSGVRTHERIDDVSSSEKQTLMDRVISRYYHVRRTKEHYLHKHIELYGSARGMLERAPKELHISKRRIVMARRFNEGFGAAYRLRRRLK